VTKPIDILTQGQHSKDITDGVCTACKKEAKIFRDELSRRENKISGFCQICQDDVFGRR